MSKVVAKLVQKHFPDLCTSTNVQQRYAATSIDLAVPVSADETSRISMDLSPSLKNKKFAQFGKGSPKFR